MNVQPMNGALLPGDLPTEPRPPEESPRRGPIRIRDQVGVVPVPFIRYLKLTSNNEGLNADSRLTD